VSTYRRDPSGHFVNDPVALEHGSELGVERPEQVSEDRRVARWANNMKGHGDPNGFRGREQ
jgi:hypothetical protein